MKELAPQFGQCDKWNICLTARTEVQAKSGAMMTNRNRREPNVCWPESRVVNFLVELHGLELRAKSSTAANTALL